MLAWILLAVAVVALLVVLVVSSLGRSKLTAEHGAILAREKAKLRSADQALDKLEAEVERLRQAGGGGAPMSAERERALADREARVAEREAALAAKETALGMRETQLVGREQALVARAADVSRREQALTQAAAPVAAPSEVAAPAEAEEIELVPEPQPMDLGGTALLDRTMMLDSSGGS